MPRTEVFIGGTGQSGTSTLNAMLWGHPEMLVCPLETCFIVGPNGLVDVVRGVSDEFCFFRLDSILHEFDRLMHHHLASPRSYPYNRFDLATFFGRDRYHLAIEKFFSRLGISRYRGDGLTVQPLVRIGNVHSPYKFKRLRFPAWVARERTYLYHATRQPRAQALLAAHQLLDDLFGAKARQEGKAVWCEQTSTNPVFADFLHALSPEALLINIKRDPLDIALSQQAQDWAPDDFAAVCQTVRAMIERWLEHRSVLPQSAFLEVRFEELVTHPEQELGAICQAIGISYHGNMLTNRPDSRWLDAARARRASADLTTYRTILGPTAEQIGYTVH